MTSKRSSAVRFSGASFSAAIRRMIACGEAFAGTAMRSGSRKSASDLISARLVKSVTSSVVSGRSARTFSPFLVLSQVPSSAVAPSTLASMLPAISASFTAAAPLRRWRVTLTWASPTSFARATKKPRSAAIITGNEGSSGWMPSRSVSSPADENVDAVARAHTSAAEALAEITKCRIGCSPGCCAQFEAAAIFRKPALPPRSRTSRPRRPQRQTRRDARKRRPE